MLDSLSGCLTPIIPMLIVSAMFKTLTAVLGENMLNVLASSSDLYVLFTFVGDAAFYFLPIAIGYTSAKKFGVIPVLGILMGAILIHPTFIGLADEGAAFSILGIPTTALNYTSSIDNVLCRTIFQQIHPGCCTTDLFSIFYNSRYASVGILFVSTRWSFHWGVHL